MAKISRRSFIKASWGALAGASLVNAGMGAEPVRAASRKVVTGAMASIPKAKGARVVVVGGGWSGLTIAKYLKRENAKLDVVLIDSRPDFMSCPMSNLWLADLVNLEFLTHSFLDAAKTNNYTFFNATVVDVDLTSRKVVTEQGYVAFDYLVLAPGIDYDYAAIGVNDPEARLALQTNYPAAFKPGSEHLSLKRKLAEFKGGNFVLTVPSGNYRCLTAPYERACMVAAVFKRDKIKGKVLLLDANPEVTSMKNGFHAAFDELYKEVLEYHPSITITDVDPFERTVKTDFESYNFDDAAIYPRIRGAVMLEKLGLIDPKSQQKEAHIDALKYNVIGNDRVYVTGDSRSQPFSKSGNTARTEGRYVAKVIAAHAMGTSVPWTSPQTSCYSVVQMEPMAAIRVESRYTHDPAKGFSFADVSTIEERSAEQAKGAIAWAKENFRDMFS